jgi:hypothetical protein
MKPKLVKIDVVLALLGHSADKVYALADGGSANEPGFLGVFNLAVSPKARGRDLRFWMAEVACRASGDATKFHSLTLDEVLNEILPPSRVKFRGSEIDQMFQFRRNGRLRLLHGERRGRTFFYSRDLLAGFLKSRWIGANAN